MSSKMLELNNEQAKAMSYMTTYLMKDSSNDKCKDILTIIVVGVFQTICDNRGFTDPRFCDGIIAEITNHVEYMLRDFNEYECDKLYGPMMKKETDEYMKCKQNLSSVYGHMVSENKENAD